MKYMDNITKSTLKNNVHRNVYIEFCMIIFLYCTMPIVFNKDSTLFA